MSTKSIAEKLLIKPLTTVWLSHPDRRDLIEPVPADATFVDRPAAATIGVIFADSATALRELLATHGGEVKQLTALWVAYPKGNRIDLNRDTLWPILGEYGMRPISQIAIDDVWSALRFRPLRAGEEHLTGGQN